MSRPSPNTKQVCESTRHLSLCRQPYNTTQNSEQAGGSQEGSCRYACELDLSSFTVCCWGRVGRRTRSGCRRVGCMRVDRRKAAAGMHSCLDFISLFESATFSQKNSRMPNRVRSGCKRCPTISKQSKPASYVERIRSSPLSNLTTHADSQN